MRVDENGKSHSDREVTASDVVVLTSVFVVIGILIFTACMCYRAGCNAKMCCRRLLWCFKCACCCDKRVKPIVKGKGVARDELIRQE